MTGTRAGLVVAVVATLATAAAPLGAQVAADTAGRTLSLEEALERAAGASEQVQIARASFEGTRGDVLRARAARQPQLGASASYQRTLASQFESFGGGGGETAPPPPPICQGPFTPDPALPLPERIAQLEERIACPPSLGFDFGATGFGSENTYNLGLNLSFPLYAGGRLGAQADAADAGRDAAEIGVSSAEAQLRLDVTQAYFDAQLADRLVGIAETQLAQANEVLRLSELGQRVGQQAEFDVLRSRVARDNLVPPLVQARSNRELAYDRLRLALDLPLDEAVSLSTPLASVENRTFAVDADSVAAIRAPVRQAAAALRVQQAQLRIARSQRRPSISLSSQYGLVAFPQNLLPNADQFSDNWTVTAAVQVPVYTGGRIRGDVVSAQAALTQSQAQLTQARELALLDTRSALAQLAAARAAVEAVSTTVEQAERAYAIAELRYREGISTLLELNDVRLQLAQARTQQASALRDLQVTQTRVELLPFLPVSTASGIGPNANAGVPNGAGNARAAQTGGARQPTAPTGQPAGAPAGPGTGNFQ